MRGGVEPWGHLLPSCPAVGVQGGVTSLGTSQAAQHITQSLPPEQEISQPQLSINLSHRETQRFPTSP